MAQVAAGLNPHPGAYQRVLSPTLTAASLSCKIAFLRNHQAQHKWKLTTDCSLCSSYQITLNQEQAVGEPDLHYSPTQEAPEQYTPGASIRAPLTSFTNDKPKGQTWLALESHYREP